MAKSKEAGRREARSRSISHRQNLSAAWDRDSPPPLPAPMLREDKVNPKEKELHSVARNKVVTNPRSIPRKVKDVMTHGETSQEPSNMSVKQVTLLPEGLRKIKQSKRV